MKWPQIVIIVQMVLYLFLVIRDGILDRNESHAVVVYAILIAFAVAVGNVFVLSAGGFW